MAFELPHQPLRVRFGCFLRRAVAVFVTGRDVRGFDEQRRELRSAQRVAAHRQRPQRVAVITLPPGNEMAPLRLPDFDEILARELEGGLHRFGATRNEIHMRGTRRRIGNSRSASCSATSVVKKLVCA